MALKHDLRPWIGRRILVNLTGDRGPEAVAGTLTSISGDQLVLEHAVEIAGREQHDLPGVTGVPAHSIRTWQVI